MPETFLRSLGERFDPKREEGKLDPESWLKNRIGAHGWSKQLEIMRSVQNNQRTAVPSCHGSGKSQVAAWTITRFIDTHEPGTAFVVTTAPRSQQVRAILWRYIKRIHKQAGLDGTIGQGQVPEWKIDGELVGFGRKPADMDADTFQGLHEYNLLIVFDEACGIREDLYTAAESLMTNQGCHWLCIGNPDDRSSFFQKVCTTEPGWNVIPISAFDTPNLTGEPVPDDVAGRLISKEWVEDKKERWGETSALYTAKVRGEWADAEDGLVPLSWAKQAVDRGYKFREENPGQLPTGRTVIGVDPAWMGSDRSVIVVRKGAVVLKTETYRKLDTGALASVVVAEAQSSKWADPVVVIDTVGVGAGVVDQVRQAGVNVVEFNGARATKYKDRSGTWGFPNCRSAAWYRLREILDPVYGGRLCLPDDDDLIAEICAPTYKAMAGGKYAVEQKADMKKRIGRSPDLADALCYSLWIDPPGKYWSSAEALEARLNGEYEDQVAFIPYTNELPDGQTWYGFGYENSMRDGTFIGDRWL